MCLLAVAYRAHAGAALIVSANRDEYYARPTAPMHWWRDAPILAGRDLEAGGSWLGISRDGRFAALTNVRGANAPPRDARSRGTLVADFLRSAASAAEWSRVILDGCGEFAGFNLLVFDGGELYCLSNTPPARRRIEPGVHALGNAVLDHSWPKIEHAREQLADKLDRGEPDLDSLLTLLSSRRTSAAHLLPDTGLDPKMEELLSSPFIVSDLYGTRASTALILEAGGRARVAEQCFEHGEYRVFNQFEFTLEKQR